MLVSPVPTAPPSNCCEKTYPTPWMEVLSANWPRALLAVHLNFDRDMVETRLLRIELQWAAIFMVNHVRIQKLVNLTDNYVLY